MIFLRNLTGAIVGGSPDRDDPGLFRPFWLKPRATETLQDDDLDGSISVHLGGTQLARSAAGAAPRLRAQAHGRAPVGGVPVGPRNGDRAHPWRQWRPGQLKTKLHVPRSELA